jgi:signal peptidase I
MRKAGMTIMTKVRQVLRRHWLVMSAVALGSVLLALHAHFQLTIVVGNSMLPTLKSGDVLLVDRLAYKNTEPHRGDIVIARYAAELIVKRIVGLPGEELEVRAGTLYINGTPHREGYRTGEGILDVAKGKLFDGDFATLGDNRAIPAELAVHPILSRPDILGKVIFASGKRL